MSYDYTYCVISPDGKKAKFRDITGADLEFLSSMFTQEKEIVLSAHDRKNLLELLILRGVHPAEWSTQAVFEASDLIFTEVIQHEFMTKPQWLKSLYSIQNQSFAGMTDMELQPMNKFKVMIDLHNEAMNKIKPPTNEPG